MSGYTDFPIALQLRGRRVLLVGAGRIATGRLHQLLEVGALVDVVAPVIDDATAALVVAGGGAAHRRRWKPDDNAGASVIFTATDDPEVNRAVVEDARRRGILANAADAPELCDFNVPSIGRRGPLTVAVSTSGQAPGLARAVRLRLLNSLGPEWGRLARLIGRLRRVLPAGPARAARLGRLEHEELARLFAARDQRAVRSSVRRALAAGTSEEAES